MTPASLAAALRACAAGLYTLEAGTGLLIAHGTFLHRSDFTSRFILHGTTGMAVVDWDALTATLTAGELPCSAGERRILCIAASLAAGHPVSLCDAMPGIDQRNLDLVVTAVRLAAGQRP